MSEITITKDNMVSLYPDSVSVTFDDRKFTIDQMESYILHNQGVVNRIKAIIKEGEMEVKYMERKKHGIESESHNLHHEWVAKLERIDMFRKLLL